MKSRQWILALAAFVFGAAFASITPGHAAHAVQAQVINGGTVNSVAAGFNPTAVIMNPDGSETVAVIVTLNNASRLRSVGISADGLSFTLDGAPLTPWAALTALGNAAVATKVNAVFQAAGAVAPLTGP